MTDVDILQDHGLKLYVFTESEQIPPLDTLQFNATSQLHIWHHRNGNIEGLNLKLVRTHWHIRNWRQVIEEI